MLYFVVSIYLMKTGGDTAINYIRIEEKALLNINEFCEYLGIGKSKARQLLRGRNGFGVQLGNSWYANKRKLDKWLESNSN